MAKPIVDVTFRAHRALGPGLLESVYEAVLASELQKRGLSVVQQQVIPVVYEGTRFEMGFRADLVVQECVIVEVKSIAEVAAVHQKQLAHVPAAGGQAAWIVDQFQRSLDQGWHYSHGQRIGRIISRQAAKHAKKDRQETGSASLVAATGRARFIRGLFFLPDGGAVHGTRWAQPSHAVLTKNERLPVFLHLAIRSCPTQC